MNVFLTCALSPALSSRKCRIGPFITVIRTNDISQSVVKAPLLEETRISCCGLDATRIPCDPGHMGALLVAASPLQPVFSCIDMRSDLILLTPALYGPLTSPSVRA